MIQAALNGGRGRDFHPAVPISPEDLAADAVAAVAAGAACLHVHPRDADGLQTLEPAPVEAALSAIRAAVPGTPVGISTGDWIAPRGSARIGCLRALTVRPDYVSVNLSEDDAAAVVEACLALGIGIEAGVASVEDALALARMPDRRRFLRVLVEIPDLPGAEAVATFEAVLEALLSAGIRLPLLAHGFDDSLWAVNRAAAALGLDLRAGLEDGRLMPDGTIAAGNAALVAAARALGQSGAATSIR